MECKRYYNIVKTAFLKAADLIAGSSPVRRMGIGVEFEDFRVYSEGDDIKRIDWRVTARKPSIDDNYELFVREYRAERNLKPLLLFDNTSSMDFWDKSFTALYVASCILQIFNSLGDLPTLAILSNSVKVYRSVKPDILSFILAREVCVSKPRGSSSILKFLSIVGKHKPVFVITDYAHSVEEIKKLILILSALDIPGLFILITSPEEKIAYFQARITLTDPESDFSIDDVGDELRKSILAHMETIRELVSIYMPVIEITSIKDAEANIHKIYLNILNTREKSF